MTLKGLKGLWTIAVYPIVSRAIADWAAPGKVDHVGLAYAVLHDLENHGYRIVKDDEEPKRESVRMTVPEKYE